MRVIHLDDDPKALLLTKAILSHNPSITYLGGFEDEFSFFDFLLDHEVDLVILDVEMPNRSGLAIAKRVLRLNIPFVFLSNHEHYSLEAFRLAALDYFLKPLELTLFNQLLERITIGKQKEAFLSELKKKIEGLEVLLKSNKPQSIVINSTNRVDFLQFKDIIYIEGSGSISTFKVNSKSEMVTASKNLSYYEDFLIDQPEFVRINKKVIVNRNYLSAIIKVASKDFEVKLLDGSSFKMSNIGRAAIIEQLG